MGIDEVGRYQNRDVGYYKYVSFFMHTTCSFAVYAEKMKILHRHVLEHAVHAIVH